jgi:hypothetical protein
VLGVARSTVEKWAREGRRLIYDDERDASGFCYVTRASVEAEKQKHCAGSARTWLS